MTIAHRPFSAGFGRDHHTTRRSRGSVWGWGHAEEPESGTHEPEGNIVSYPWEGLYLEVSETTVSSGEAPPQPNAQLGLFLTSLMYGE